MMIPHRADFARGGDTAANGKGKLASVTGPTNSYARSTVYDSKGRASIVGASINSESRGQTR